MAAPCLLAQTYQLEAFGHTPDTLLTHSVTSKSGVVRSPAGTDVTPDGLTSTHPAGASISVTTPAVSHLGTPMTFLGWAPTSYDPINGYAAAVTTNPLAITLNANRLLVGYAGYTVAEAINTPGRTWASGGNALWTGTYDVLGPDDGGVARATTLREVGDEAWLETTFTAPTIISYAWRLDIPSGAGARLEALIAGQVADSETTATNPSWKRRTLDLTGSGPVKVRFRLTHTATSTIGPLVDKRESAYLAHIRTGTFAAPTRVVVSGTSGTAATLSWDAAYAAESYTAQLATDDLFTQGILTQNLNIPTVTTTFGGLTPGGTYFYRVIARRTAYEPLSSASGSFVAVTRAAQTITFPQISSKTLGAAPFPLGATASSELPVIYTVVSGPASSGNDGLITITGTGSVVVRAEQLGDHAFEPAPSVTREFSVAAPASARVTLAAATRTYNGVPQAVTATTTPPGLFVTYSYQLGTAPPTSQAPTDVGSYSVKATLNVPGLTVAPAKSTLKIVKAPLTVTGIPAERLVGQDNPTLGLTYSGFVGEDDVSDLDTRPSPATTAKVHSPASGIYPITFTGGLDNNYSFVLGSPPAYLNVLGFGTTFEALVLDADLLPTGKLTITPSKNSLAYTGSLTLAAEAKVIPLPAGRTLTPSNLTTGTDTVTFNLPATRDLAARSYTLIFTLTAGNSIEGTLQLGGATYGNLAQGRHLYLAAPRTTLGSKGVYTLILPPATPASLAEGPSAPLPEGAGHATGTITDAGQLTLAGKLADGTAFTAAALPDSNHGYRLFIKPYGARLHQRFGGYLPLASSEEFTTVPTTRFRVAAATFVWAKPGLAADKSYRQGFGPLLTEANLENWQPPAARVPARGATPEQPAITLAQRLDLADSPTADGPFELEYQSTSLTEFQVSAQPANLSLKAAGTVLLPTPNSSGFKLTLTPKTGAFTGQFTVTEPLLPPAKKPLTRTASFSGVLRQGPTADSTLIGQGHFILPALKGASSTETTSGSISFFVPTLAP